MGLITDIQNEIVNSDVPLASIMRKANLLAYQLDNSEFKTWVDWELNGYPTDRDWGNAPEEFPEYRKSKGEILCHLTDGYRMVENLPVRPPVDAPGLLVKALDELSDIWLFQGIPAIEKMINNAEHHNFLIVSLPNHGMNLLASMYQMNVLKASKRVPSTVLYILMETVRDRLLRFTLELKQQYPHLDKNNAENSGIVPSAAITRLLNATILVENGGHVSMFDQREQTVSGNQYNAARDINFSGVQNQVDYVKQLENLQAALSQVAQSGTVDEEAATDAEYHLTKAVQQAKKDQPEKSTLLTHLQNLKNVAQGAVALGGLVVAIEKAIELANQIF